MIATRDQQLLIPVREHYWQRSLRLCGKIGKERKRRTLHHEEPRSQMVFLD
jgi:hypothetical protein